MASPTPTARAASAHRQGGGHRRRGARTARHCAKKSSFHARGGHIHRKHRPAGCAKHRSAKHNSVKHGSAKRKTHHVNSARKPAHAGDACPGADLRPTQENIEAVRTATLCLVNQERTSRGESALQPNGHLQQSAQSHTESMAFGDYFEHDGPGGNTPLSRMIAAGYLPGGKVGYEIGENIGWGTLSLGTPRAIVAAWMASPGHRANILDAHFQDTAIGVSPHVPSSLSGGQSGGIYTQDFGVITTG
ncbi:MAG TPA: CAP domain-containing protein [Solirubrobacteraceae bacterium]